MPPNRSDVPAATASIAAAVAVLLATLGVTYTRSHIGYAGLAAATVTFGAASALAQLYRAGRMTVFRASSAAGGIALLTLGVLVAVSRFTTLDEVFTLTTLATVYLTPPAVVACLVGGIGQLPGRWAPRAGFSVLGAAATGWFALGPDTAATRGLVVVSAILALLGCVPVLADTRRGGGRHRGWRSVAVTVAAAILAATMVYAVVLAATPVTWWPARAPSIVLAWAYIIAAALPVVAGVTYRDRPAHPEMTG
ncbi:hypothetical protein [Corynebacterium pygosceleis]|uniref:hypothetical protein n=1 Tax=Corynebacterium pygosceleis TaxID=2800406 RepID=UPI001908EC82|nr:hypothetical protein [Corynebacterium pygosceleis]MCK7674257.1 hypothetical protein [Corynebacterium pygosceleis]MCL0120445.1 hypothetical protein [Corynebacterium pygosceleis]